MIATDKVRLTAYISPELDDKVRIFCVKHRKTVNISELVEAALLHCFADKQFINKISPKKEEEIDY
jgi:hypothetical protein